MQRSGQTAKTQSSAKAPGRRALPPRRAGREGARSRAGSQQAGGSGSRERSGSGAVPTAPSRRGVPGLGPSAAPQRPALCNAPPRPCGELRSLSRGRACEQHHPHGTGSSSRPQPAGSRDGREGAGSEQPGRVGYGAPRPERANFGGGRARSRAGRASRRLWGEGGWEVVFPRRFSYLRHQRHQRLLHGARADLQPRVRAQPRRGRRRDAAAAARGRGHSG